MKNKYSKDKLELHYKYFMVLKKSMDYRTDYLVLTEMNKASKRYSGNDKTIADKLHRNCFEWWCKITDKWNIYSPINPSLKLKQEDLTGPIRPRSVLARFIYAFIEPNQELIKRKEVKPTVTKRTKSMDEQVERVICYALFSIFKKYGKTRFRQLGRMFDIDKKTVKKRMSEYEKMSPNERDLFIEEALRGTKFPDADMMDSYHKKRTSFNQLAYALDETGNVAKTGRVSKKNID